MQQNGSNYCLSSISFKPKLLCMRKYLVLVCCLFFITAKSDAQYVNIPDSNFRKFLIQQYPACFNSAKMLDTVCAKNSTKYSLAILSNPVVRNMTGIEYFQNLKSINISVGSHVISIPKLPLNLRTLSITSDSLTTLPILPDSLQNLYTLGTPLISLPTLPSSLSNLNCGGGRLTFLPNLPNSLTYLNCSTNNISILPAIPYGLKSLICNETKLSNLPILPDSLNELDISVCLFTRLPTLPQKLKKLTCGDNNISVLNNLPPYLTKLDINGSGINCITKLPNTLKSLGATFNWQIFCLPNFPDSCVYSDNLNYSTLIPPVDICNPTNNPNHCQSFPVIQSFVYTDKNTNGVFDINEYPKHNLKLTLSNYNYSYTNTQGIAYTSTDSLGTYTITATPPNFYNVVPASYTHNFTSYDTLVIDTFTLQPTVLIDSIAIKLTPTNWAARAGRAYPYLVNYENLGTTVLSNTVVSLNYDNILLNYDNSSVGGVTNSSSGLSLNIGNIVPGQTGDFVAYFTVKPAAKLGSNVTSVASITTNTVAATDSVQSVVSGSYDPNDKQATPSLTTQQVADGNYINYTIRFQNTGTDTAFNVVIADTLDSKLMATELQMVGSSHNCKTTVKDNIIFFEFLNIYLPDSNVNKTGSNGFVSFKLKPVSSVVAGTTIPNKAAIYFDYNSPVITKTANTIIQNPLPLQLLNYEASPTPPKEGVKNWKVLNKWTTANEVNTSHFIVQRSEDGRIYKSVGSIAAKGFGEYSFIDNSLLSGFETVYYQLQMVDKDGKFTYSKVVKISSNIETLDGVMIVENPARHQLKLNVIASSLNNTIASVLNAQGKIVKAFTLKQGYQTIDISGFADGVYYLQTKIGSHKLVVE